MHKHIVLIEDDPGIAEITRLILEDAGYHISVFNAFTSLEELTALGAAGFILDENLPVMSGHIICMLLKSKPATRHIPVILFSAGTGLQRAVDLGEANAGIAKPYEIEHFLKVISHTIG